MRNVECGMWIFTIFAAHNKYHFNMKTRFLLLFLLCSLFAKAQTIALSGLQSGVWEADTVLITGDVTIQDSLRILPGTTVLFNGYYSIKAEEGASIMALGTETDSITFTVTDTTGFHLFNLGRGGWNGIRLQNAGLSRFEYCRLQYGKATFDDDQDGGALRILNCDEVEVSHSTLFCNFSREHGGALNAEWSNVVMHDCNVSNNLTYTGIDTVYFMYGGGLRFINCEVELVDMAFRYNDGRSAIGGALSIDSCSVNIDRCVFEHNHGINGAGLYMIRCYERPCNISNSLFANNYSEHFGGGLAISDSSPEMNNLTVVDNYSYGVTCGGIFFYQHSSPIVRNCVIYGNEHYNSLNDPIQIWIWTYDDYVPEFHNCLIEFGLENITGHENVQVYGNCLDENPLFVDPENENYRLSAESPCLNAGLTYDDDLTALDLDKSWRVCNSGIDLGAYEYTATGIAEAKQDVNPVHIVGNPITDASYAEIELESECNLTASVYSLDGKLLNSKHITNLETGLNRIEVGELFQGLVKGTYLITFSTTRQTIAAKVVL